MRSASFSGVHVHDIRASQRQSFAGRISHRVATGLSFADLSFREVRTGTVTGTTINTLCSVIGAGVLSLPLALYYSSVFVGLALLLVLASFAAFSVYLLVVGCDATGRYSITEVVAFALYPPQLWEEYLYQKGKERSAPLPTASDDGDGNGAVAPSDEKGDGSDSNAKAARATAVGPAESGSAHPSTTQPNMSVSRDAANPPDATADAQDAHRHRRGCHQSRHSARNASSLGNADGDDRFSFPTTSAYAGLHDAYARQEWHYRRCRRIVTVLMEFVVFCSNYGTLVIYSKVIADSMPPVVSYITHSEGFLVSKYFWLAAGGVVFFVLSCARNMEELKWSSLLGFLTILYIVLVILYRYHTKHVSDYPHVDPKSYGSIHWMSLSVKMLQTLSTFGLALSYHYNVPYFYKELKDRRPRCMMGSVAVAFPIIIMCYAMTGFFGYLTFGNEVADRKIGGNVVSNYPKDDVPMNIGRLGLFAHFACVFPVVSICTRRGLHRLMMIGLTWAEQSALMREAAVAAGAILTDEEARRDGATSPPAAEGEELPGEASFLLHTTTNAPPPTGYEVFPSSSLATGPAPTATHPPLATAVAGGGGGGGWTPAYNAVSAMHHNADADDSDEAYISPRGPPGTVDVDRDVGSPDLTTTLAIVIEAAFLVFTTVLIAATVSGIDFVIHIIGTLFSVFIVMVAPGMVGWCVFSPNGPFGSATTAAAAYSTQQQQDIDNSGNAGSTDVALNSAASRYRFIRLKQAMCVVNAVVGVCITCIGVAVLAYDTAKGPHMPTI
ncbi:transmembrane amino acid transporter protein- like protein [Leptomonas pyrrhocoris]|uniref:Transmembrane amino acid transporter protein-like protein n=1 Tax=Leptomonas pyrrhocoris TaxID=157538 RepID=A0A0M9G3I4_LEPPY|nr:transmembrane amino acid transporter protein- like protein [Leptomonas pyrrhocoris]KPA81503.1 transmembrane amino acid transporter protein- like protein [Leptomonas pyrrhocoris]|eukprot:XP_015659942.1 transmembrane amino acid transporter protein- like protein [Leptomonas pyrrhocoris]